MRRAGLTGLLLLAACSEPAASPAADTSIPPAEIQSGSAFLQADTLALQEDDFANPGFLWVHRGGALFNDTTGQSKSCASCHGADGEEIAAAAAHYPQIDKESGALVNLEGRINLCRTRHQGRDPLAYESDQLLALTAYVANLARGEPVSVDVTGAAAEAYEAGRDYFFTRRGQFNLACNQCHDENWGRKLRGDTISQGHGNGFPAYRFEWQSLGSLQRRLRDCDAGVRAEPRDFGSDTYLAVELYLAKRAEGLPVETPAVRR